jgi:hypothetical protein
METNQLSTVYAGAASLLNADALAATLDPVAPAIMPKSLLSLEVAELSVVASASLTDVADILRQQEIHQLVHQSILGRWLPHLVAPAKAPRVYDGLRGTATARAESQEKIGAGALGEI